MESQNISNMDNTYALHVGSVGVLVVLRLKDSNNERYVILIEQPQICAHGASFLELPAANLEERTGDIIGEDMEEIEDATGLRIRREDTINMTEMALEHSLRNEHLPPAIQPSPTTPDEYVSVLLWDKDLEWSDFENLVQRFGSNRAENEPTTVRVHHFEALWGEGSKNARMLSAWALYEGLNRSGRIEQRLHELRTGQTSRRPRKDRVC
ncbi:Nudix hydrolase 14 chloroplastic [Pyrenophora seminiperda CCB06]|uniref:Nudix hydrolase 14 chloroplastic n=1 Tax=Pyrenophora seminiperda CCB06 TaxID=1302712 RepID=A0A3M7LXE0_9PLEO|nr:Nudix hydrolase 14 chloroplastic [Pyrenophora seminiperda CCB06]